MMRQVTENDITLIPCRIYMILGIERGKRREKGRREGKREEGKKEEGGGREKGGERGGRRKRGKRSPQQRTNPIVTTLLEVHVRG